MKRFLKWLLIIALIIIALAYFAFRSITSALTPITSATFEGYKQKIQTVYAAGGMDEKSRSALWFDVDYLEKLNAQLVTQPNVSPTMQSAVFNGIFMGMDAMLQDNQVSSQELSGWNANMEKLKAKISQ